MVFRAIDFGRGLIRFEEIGSKYFTNASPKKQEGYLEVGHDKPNHLRIVCAVARENPDVDVVYYDNSRPGDGGAIDSENIGLVELVSATGQWLAKMFGLKKNRKMNLPKNLRITKSPKGLFNYASIIWALHEFDNPREILEKVYGEFLLPNGRVGIMDYVFGGISRDEFREVFGVGVIQNEKNALENEGFEDCYKRHTLFSPASLRTLVEDVGFRVDIQEEDYINVGGREIPRVTRLFGEKRI